MSSWGDSVGYGILAVVYPFSLLCRISLFDCTGLSILLLIHIYILPGLGLL